MLTFRRALVVASFFLAVLFLIANSQASAPEEASDAPPRRGNGAKEVPPPPPPKGSAQRRPPPPEQKPLADMSKLTLYGKLEYLYPYDVGSKFPAYIWQTWKSTPAHPDFKFREEETSWTLQHPGFVHEVVTDAVAPDLLRLLYGAVPEVLEAYAALPLPVLKADFFRYLILLARGGIYSDIDTFAIRSAVEWIPERVSRDAIGLVIGIEADADRPDWQEWYSRRIQFCQWTIQAKPGHPALRDTVARITQEALHKKRNGLLDDFKDFNVIEFTGPAIWTDAVFDYLNDPRYFDLGRSPGEVDWRNFTGMEMPRKVGDVLVLPITSFSPGVQQMGAKDYDDPMAFVKHDFEGSWKPEVLRHIGEQ